MNESKSTKAPGSARTRDFQQSKVYGWEREAAPDVHWTPVFATPQDAADWLAPIWRKERGRVGLARKAMPRIESSSWGQRRALAHSDHRITLPLWARSTWVVLHEAAHLLTPGDRHGPRFVGVLIGLACRHLDLDAQELMRIADTHGVKYSVRAIGSVPVHGPSWHVERAVATEGPMTAMDLASWLNLGMGVDITPPSVRGAALSLIRRGRARWLRNKLVLLDPAPAAAPT